MITQDNINLIIFICDINNIIVCYCFVRNDQLLNL